MELKEEMADRWMSLKTSDMPPKLGYNTEGSTRFKLLLCYLKTGRSTQAESEKLEPVKHSENQ